MQQTSSSTKQYAGWIPTAGGRLSFNLIGYSKYPTPTITSNQSEGDYRHIISFQKRNLIDSSFPVLKILLARTIFGLDGVFWCLCDAHTEKSGEELTGRLYLFSDKKKWKETAKSIKEYQGKLDCYQATQTTSSLNKFYEENVSNDIMSIKYNAAYFVDFRLLRNGTAYITIPSDAPSLDTPDQNNPGTKMEQIVCAQLFFFLKDICHRHQHHHPKSDTITDIYMVNGDDNTWREQTLKQLYRKVLDLKRDQAKGIYSSAQGILSYVRSFREQCDESVNCKRLDDELEKSICASQDDLRFKQAKSQEMISFILGMIFTLFGLLIAMTGILQVVETNLKVKYDGYFFQFITYSITEHPAATLGYCIFLVYSFLIVFRLVDWKDMDWVKDYYRTILSIRTAYSGIITAALSAALIGLSVAIAML